MFTFHSVLSKLKASICYDYSSFSVSNRTRVGAFPDCTRNSLLVNVSFKNALPMPTETFSYKSTALSVFRVIPLTSILRLIFAEIKSWQFRALRPSQEKDDDSSICCWFWRKSRFGAFIIALISFIRRAISFQAERFFVFWILRLHRSHMTRRRKDKLFCASVGRQPHQSLKNNSSNTAKLFDFIEHKNVIGFSRSCSVKFRALPPTIPRGIPKVFRCRPPCAVFAHINANICFRREHKFGNAFWIRVCRRPSELK